MSMSGMPSDIRKSWFAGLIVLAVAVVIGYLAFSANQGRPPFAQPAQVKALFDNVGQLSPGDEVRKNSQRIGAVSDIKLRPDRRVLVTMDLDGDPRVYADATASLRDQSVLAKKFVELDLGHAKAGALRDRTITAIKPDQQAQEIAKLLDVFDPQTRASLSSGLQTLGFGVAGHGQNLNDFLGAAPNLLTDVQKISNAAASSEANVSELLRSTDRIASRFTGRTQQLTSLVDNMNGTLRAINVDGAAPLGDTIDKLPASLSDVRGGLDALNGPLGDTQAAMASLESGAKSLGAATPDVRGVLREGITPVDKIPAVAGKANPAVDNLRGTLHDLRPFVPRVTDAVRTALVPLSVIAPYHDDIATVGHDFSTLLGGFGGGDFRHALRVSLTLPGATVLNGLTPVPSVPYGAPGEAVRVKAPAGSALSFLVNGDKGK